MRYPVYLSRDESDLVGTLLEQQGHASLAYRFKPAWRSPFDLAVEREGYSPRILELINSEKDDDGYGADPAEAALARFDEAELNCLLFNAQRWIDEAEIEASEDGAAS